MDISDVTIEFFSDSEEHLQILESQLKHIRDVDVYLIEPKEAAAPALVAIGITKRGERAAVAAHNIAQVLHDFIFLDGHPALARGLHCRFQADILSPNVFLRCNRIGRLPCMSSIHNSGLAKCKIVPGAKSSTKIETKSPRPLRWAMPPSTPKRGQGAVGTLRRSMPKSSVIGTPSFSAHAA